jgi:uncharacterized small protein (DUF1192 family)
MSGKRSVIPLTDGLVVYSIARLDQSLSAKVAEVRKMQLELQGKKQKGADAVAAFFARRSEQKR